MHFFGMEVTWKYGRWLAATRNQSLSLWKFDIADLGLFFAVVATFLAAKASEQD